MFAATFREMDILLKSNRAILKEVGNLISNPAYESLKNDSEIRKGITFPVLVSSTPDNKGNKNLLSIKRFSITTILENKEKAHVYITVKESVEKGHRIYSVEVMDIKKRL